MRHSRRTRTTRGRKRKTQRRSRETTHETRKFKGGQRDIDVRFGVELEMCIKLDKACTGENIHIEPRALNVGKSRKLGVEGLYYSQIKVQWIDKFLKYAEHYIKPNPITPKIRDKYQYVFVKGWSKYSVDYIYDLTDFTLKPHSGRIDYTKPFFNTDGSLFCGDSSNFNASKNPELLNTFNMEFITPILSSIDDLKDLLEFIGLTKKGCFITNKSAGYHVNISLFDKNEGKPLPLTETFFTDYFYPNYKSWEIEWYPRVRSEVSDAAKPLASLPNNNVLTKAYDKYYSMYIKDEFLYEIRAFGASTDIPTLVNYTTQAISLIYDPYMKYLEDQSQ